MSVIMLDLLFNILTATSVYVCYYLRLTFQHFDSYLSICLLLLDLLFNILTATSVYVCYYDSYLSICLLLC